MPHKQYSLLLLFHGLVRTQNCWIFIDLQVKGQISWKSPKTTNTTKKKLKGSMEIDQLLAETILLMATLTLSEDKSIDKDDSICFYLGKSRIDCIFDGQSGGSKLTSGKRP